MRAVFVIFASCYLNNRYMINLVLKGFEQGSKILEIEAAVLRVMEKSSIRPKEIDTELNVAKTEGHLMMVFVVKEVSFDGLANLKKEFGNDFTLTVVGKTKSELFLGIEAPRESFLNLGKRYSYQEPGQIAPRPTYNSSQPSQPH